MREEEGKKCPVCGSVLVSHGAIPVSEEDNSTEWWDVWTCPVGGGGYLPAFQDGTWVIPCHEAPPKCPVCSSELVVYNEIPGGCVKCYIWTCPYGGGTYTRHGAFAGWGIDPHTELSTLAPALKNPCEASKTNVPSQYQKESIWREVAVVLAFVGLLLLIAYGCPQKTSPPSWYHPGMTDEEIEYELQNERQKEDAWRDGWH